MTNPLIRKLELGQQLSQADRELVTSLMTVTRQVAPKTDLVLEGDQPSFVHVMLSGFACRYKSLSSGKRQIVALLVPGDFCDLHVHILGKMDHTIETIDRCTVAMLSREQVEQLLTRGQSVTRALLWGSLVDEGTLREWLLSLGQRSAAERMAHLICEIRLRLDIVGLVDNDEFYFPFKQRDLGDLLGLTIVHANRIVQELRRKKLIVLKSRQMRILDLQGLERLAEFNPGYLHLSGSHAISPN